jgi:NAD-dependent DNA ligase
LKKHFTVCFTGKMWDTRAEMHSRARRMGHTPVNSVTKNTELLVMADFKSVSIKARRARRDGTRLLTEEAFRHMPMKKTAKAINEYIDVNMFEEFVGLLGD